MKLFKEIDVLDFFIFIGLILIGYGLFLLKGLGFSLTTVGFIFLFFGILGSIPYKLLKKGKALEDAYKL